MKKRVLVYILLICMVLSPSQALASHYQEQNNKVQYLDKKAQEEVEELLDKLVSIRLKKNRMESTDINNSYSGYKVANLDEVTLLQKEELSVLNTLESKGVRKLSLNEEERFNLAMHESMTYSSINSNITPLESAPPQWGPYANVDILTWGEKYVDVNGVNVKIWVTYAIPKDGGGPPLYKNFEPFFMTNQPTEWAHIRNKIIDYLVTTALGEIKYIGFLPWDWFLPERTEYTSFDSYSVDVAYMSRMKYVFKYFPSSDKWSLTGSSNNVTTDEVHTTRNVINGGIKNLTKTTQNLYYAANYSNIERLAAESIGGYITDSVDRIKFRFDNSVKFTFYPYYAKYAPDLM